MAKTRSPGYPAIGLRESVEKITMVYKKDYQNRIPRSLMAQHCGYQSLNGKSLGVLSALAKFGLMEGRGEENWVSDLALQIIAHDPGSPERASALAESAVMPEVFAEIQGRYPSGASDSAIKSYLLTQKFIPQAAEIAVRTYRETMDLVASEGGSYPTLDRGKEDNASVRHSLPQVVEKPGNTPDHRRGDSSNPFAAGFLQRSPSPPDQAEAQAINDIKVVLEGSTLRIDAWVDKIGLRRLKRILDANEALVDDDEGPETYPGKLWVRMIDGMPSLLSGHNKLRGTVTVSVGGILRILPADEWEQLPAYGTPPIST